jgi:hypothetical protein
MITEFGYLALTAVRNPLPESVGLAIGGVEPLAGQASIGPDFGFWKVRALTA